MKLCISKINDEQLDEQQKKEFLEELGHWAEEIDLAKDFFTIGGLDILAPLLDHPNECFVTQACLLIANLVQNNDHCQRIIVQSGLQQKLLQLVDQSDSPDVKTKAVTAISGSSESPHSVTIHGRSLLCFVLSALIRGYTLGQLQLQKYHGARVLIDALSTPIPRLRNKICFLINTICSSSAQMKSKRLTRASQHASSVCCIFE
jgi:hsp70-interacting protein